MIIWGGLAGEDGIPSADGAAYDPAADSWRLLSSAPLEGRFGHAAAWTGRQMIVWGGSKGEADVPFTDGAAYDPNTDSWRPISDAPIAGRFFHSAVWTGAEVLMWGGRVQRGEIVGVAFDPATDTWRELPQGGLEAREGHTAVWSGQTMIVWAGSSSGPDFIRDDGAAYDPTSNNWVPIPDSPLRGRYGHSAAWSDSGQMFVWGGSDGSQNALPDGAIFAPTSNDWAFLEPFPLLGRYGHSAVWTGSELIFWGGRTGDGRQPLSRGVAHDRLALTWRGEVDAADASSPLPPDATDNLAPPSPVSFIQADCRGLIVPRNRGETNTNLDMQLGVLEISYQADGLEINFAVPFLDPACLGHPVIGPIIDHVLMETLTDLETECADLRDRLASGELFVRGRPIDPEAIRAHIDRWCL